MDSAEILGKNSYDEGTHDKNARKAELVQKYGLG